MSKSPLLKFMEQAVLKAGKSLVRDFGEVENLQVSRKGPGDFVSAADKRAEKILIDELQKGKHGYSILSEEAGYIKGDTEEFTWVIDPLDGTMNFLHGIPFFSISVALVKGLRTPQAESTAGIVFAPALNEWFFAEKGAGSFASNNKRLQVSPRRTLTEAFGATSIWRHLETNQANTQAILELSRQGGYTRILGSAALELAYVAAGKMEYFWHNFLKPWDVAAGMLLVKEARGIATTVDGNSNILETGSILAASSELHQQIQSIVSKSYTASSPVSARKEA